MSLLHTCPRCGREYETGIGDPGGECGECRQRDARLASGGFGLTGRERAALAEFLGGVVPHEEGVPHRVDERIGMVTVGDGRCTDFGVLAGRRSALVRAETLDE